MRRSSIGFVAKAITIAKVYRLGNANRRRACARGRAYRDRVPGEGDSPALPRRTSRLLALKGERVIASDLIRAEIRSAAWKYVRADMMDEDEAMGIIDDALDLVDEFIPLEENAAEAFA